LLLGVLEPRGSLPRLHRTVGVRKSWGSIERSDDFPHVGGPFIVRVSSHGARDGIDTVVDAGIGADIGLRHRIEAREPLGIITELALTSSSWPVAGVLRRRTV
jgi:hypothetical protein